MTIDTIATTAFGIDAEAQFEGKDSPFMKHGVTIISAVENTTGFRNKLRLSTVALLSRETR